MAVVGWSIVSRPSAPGPAGGEAAAVVSALAQLPPQVFDEVGAGGTAPHLRATSLPVLRGASGRPVVVYVGAEFCPYCASQRWSLAIALMRFGTFSGLSPTRSSSTDAFPDTATLSFRGASYTSELIEFSAVETADRTGAPLDSPTALQQASFDRSNSRGAIPFTSIADQYVAVGSGFQPDVLRGLSWSQIATQVADPASPVARAVLGNADRITAAICRVSGNAPASVCSSPSVRGLAPDR